MVGAALLAGFLLLLLLAVLFARAWVPNVVSCIDKNAYGPPAMGVEVTSNRRGTIAERNLFGCKLYYYEAPPDDLPSPSTELLVRFILGSSS